MTTTPVFGLPIVTENDSEKTKADKSGELALMLEALLAGAVVSRTTTATPGSPTNGQAYIVPASGVSGAWVGHEGEIAIYYNGWIYALPLAGPKWWVFDEALYVVYDEAVSPPDWVTIGSDGNAIHDDVAGEIAAVTLKASPVAGDHLLIEDSEAANVKKRVAVSSVGGGGGAAPALLGTIDLSVNNATTSEGASRQVTGMKDYKHIIVTLFGMDPTEGDTVEMRLMADGASVGSTGIINGYQAIAPFGNTLRAGLANFDFINIGSAGIGADNAHATIEGHWNSVTPTVIRSASYDNDATGTDYVQFTDSVTNAATIYDGLSFTADANTVVLGTIKVYGWN